MKIARFVFFLLLALSILWGLDLARVTFLNRTSKTPIPARHESAVTLIEGWTVDDEISFLAKEKNISRSEVIRATGRSRDLEPFDPALRVSFPFLASLPASRSLEGYLFPETYRVWDDELPVALIKKQLREFETRFGVASITKASAPLSSFDEVVTLASIVEKEVRDPSDRKIVAGIFLNRLKEGIALQSDATLTYALGSGARANAEELESDSPYNTYKYRGLPPSPIGNPSESSIRAVLDPTPTAYHYFLTDRSGNVLYARTFEEHLRNKRKAGY